MTTTPDDLHYAETHEWARVEEDGLISVGISDHAQEALGDVVYVEPPEVGVVFAAGDQAGVVESVKAASDIYSPVAGEVVEVNESLEEQPELINGSAYEDGWIFRLRSDSPNFEHLQNAEAYINQCENE
ncbi:MAG: glycine cleavage system protein GcvH [Pseudomonadales bacterium]